VTYEEINRTESICLALEPGFQIMWSSLWPLGCCVPTSLLLAPLLRASLEIDFHVVAGWAAERRAHAWIQSPEGDIIDPTYGQFDGDGPLRIWSTGTGGGHQVHRVLTLDEEERARREIKPRSTSSGWVPRGHVLAWFSELHRLAEAP
jgi:hypothetical protein